ncbi:MAG TPA: DUF4363 family protein [Clostridiaceae bacterium]|jgi:archaellum biogenesis ATPase FlaH|nr:DUF4363 family protein [Clostridiaceae bacterium]HOA82301.1 DUF4363 family protein [Defluviitaleaceae bacterium]
MGRHLFKYILQVAAILYFVITVTLSFDYVVRRDIAKMTSISEDIEQSIMEEKFETALHQFNNLNEKWHLIKEKWRWMINHSIIYEIDLTVSNLGHYINNSLNEEAIVEKHKLIKYFHNVRDLDTIRLHNIF